MNPARAPLLAWRHADIDDIARRLAVTLHAGPATAQADTPLMQGQVLGTEVQEGLFATGYDIRYLQDVPLDESVEPAILCGVLISGEAPPMHVQGYGDIAFPQGRPVLMCFGVGGRCGSVNRAGQRSAVSGFTLKPDFMARLMRDGSEQELECFARMFEQDFSTCCLPSSNTVTNIAHHLLSHGYGGALARLFLESSTLAFVAEAAKLCNEQRQIADGMSSRHYDQVVQAREMLDRDIADPPSVEQLTRLLGVNATTLRANFLTAFGTTIFGHVRNRRLETAQLLLRKRDLTVAEIGYRVGFTNPAAFATAYRRHFGYSPRHETGPRSH